MSHHYIGVFVIYQRLFVAYLTLIRILFVFIEVIMRPLTW